MEKEVRENTETKKLSYEELENIAHQLSAQAQQLDAKNKQLLGALEGMNIDNMLNRLKWLWEVTTKDNHFITDDFRKACGEEFMQLMAKPESEMEINDEEV